jgi:hypothetical protein
MARPLIITRRDVEDQELALEFVLLHGLLQRFVIRRAGLLPFMSPKTKVTNGYVTKDTTSG